MRTRLKVKVNDKIELTFALNKTKTNVFVELNERWTVKEYSLCKGWNIETEKDFRNLIDEIIEDFKKMKFFEYLEERYLSVED